MGAPIKGVPWAAELTRLTFMQSPCSSILLEKLGQLATKISDGSILRIASILGRRCRKESSIW